MEATDVKSLGLPVPADYVPSSGELDNLIYLTFKYTIGWSMRQADKAVCLSMAGDIVGDPGISKLIHETCEYAWDHLSGEPDEFTPEQLVDHIQPILIEWYSNTTPEERANTSTEQV